MNFAVLTHLLALCVGILTTVYFYQQIMERQANQCEADKRSLSASINTQYTNAQNITETIANEHQTKLDAIDRELADLNRLQPSATITVRASSPASSTARDAGATTGQLHCGHEVSSESLYAIAGKADKMKADLERCQAWADAAKKSVDDYNAGL